MQTKGFAIRSGKEWNSAYDLGDGHVATAVASSGGTVYVGWCGPCNNQGFTRGIAVGNADGTGWHQLSLPVDGTIPNRYISGFEVDPANAQHVYVAVNGFSRRFTEGPGAGVGHIFESKNGGTDWTDISANLPDVPADTVKLLPGGGLALGTDLATFYRPAEGHPVAGPGPRPAHHGRDAAASRPGRQAVRRHPRARPVGLRRTTPQGP